MSKKRSYRGNVRYGVPEQRYQSLIAIILALSVLVTMVVAEVDTKSKSERASEEVSLLSLSASSPSKEYIYAGARLIATEECQLSISPASASFAATPSGGNQNGSIGVTAQAGCSWTAISNANFITITGGATGTGNGTVNYSVASNSTGAIRNGNVTVKDRTFTVFQGIDFLDVPTTDQFYTEIGQLAARGVTLGCGNGNYCPNSPVLREQMSAFIMRAKGEFNPPIPGSQHFGDVPPSNQFYNFIDRMWVLGITMGCQPGSPPLYCPTLPVKREQMSAFILRGLGEFNPPTPSSQRFGDVPPSNDFYNFIDRMAVLNITQGCQPGNPPLYCPNDSVTRGQMAAFLVRAFNL